MSGLELVTGAEMGGGRRVLSEEQKAEYWRNGFLVVPGLVPNSALESYRARFEAVCRGEVNIPGLVVMKDVAVREGSGERVVNKIQDFQHDEAFFSYCKQPGIVSIVQDIIGDRDVLAMHTMLINKPPDPGTKTSRHPMHQDLHYFPFRPADKIVCAWTAMEPVHRSNGCLVLLPRSHSHGTLFKHGYPQWEGGVNAMYHGIEDLQLCESGERFYAEMRAGDTVFFHPLLIHGSGANKTRGFRKAISCHYASAHCDYIEVEGTSQESIAKEVMEIAKRKVGPHAQISFQDVWRLRSRPVTSLRASL